MGDKFVKLIIHHGGSFHDYRGKRQYVGGHVDVVEDKFDLDHLSYVNVQAYIKELGYVSVGAIWVSNDTIGDFCLVVDDLILCSIAEKLGNGDKLDFYVVGGIKIFPDLSSQISEKRVNQPIENNVIEENYNECYLSKEEDEELVVAREKVKKKIEDSDIREKLQKKKGEEKEDTNEDDLPELFLEADDVSFGEDDLEDSKEGEEQEDTDEDEVGSVVSDNDKDNIGLSVKDQTVKYDPTSMIPIFCIDMAFKNVTQVRQAVAKYAIVKGVGLRYYTNDKDRIRVICLVGCPWKLYVSMERNNDTMMVKTYIPNHKCYRVQNNLMATSNNLAFLLKKKIAQQPGMRVKDIRDFCKSEYKLNVGWTVCQSVRKKVFKDIVGDYIEQYGDLHDYTHEVLRTNPGSTCVVETSREESTKGEFLRFYVCFKACKEGFINGCRKVIGVDGCFLKGLCEGQLLCAIGRDGNNQMFPIAWAVVRTENAYNWGWFLKLLKYDLPLRDGEGYTIMSDMQKVNVSSSKTIIVCC